MPEQPANSYNLRSWRLYKLPPETPIAAREVKLLIDDIIATIDGYKTSVGGILVPDTKGQIITHDGTTVTLQNVGANGRIPVADSTATNGWDWKDPSVLGFMTALLVRKNNTNVGSRTAINFIDGGGITWTIVDDAPNGEVEISATVSITGANLTKTDDTNVTLTLGGTPTGALLNAVSLTLGWTGQLAVGRGGTGLSAIGSSLQFLRVNSAGTALEYATLSRMFCQCFYGDTGANLTLTNQSNAENFLAAVSRAVTLLDLTTYTQVRLVTRVQTGSASANSPRLRLRYRISFSTTVGDYSDIGTSEVSTSLTSTGVIDSGWVSLATEAKADVYVTVTQIGGDGAADPVIGFVNTYFR